MNELWILIFVAFFATNSLDKAESVKVKLELKTFDEIFGKGWWDKGEAEDLKTPAPINFGQNVHRQIDRQNTQIGQIEPNSTDQNPPVTESDHSDNAKNSKEQSEIIKEINSNKKRKIIEKFHAIKEEFKQKGKFSTKEWAQIGQKIAKHLKVSRSKIYKWKKEFGLSRKVIYDKDERKNLIEKFDQMKAELKRGGSTNSFKNELDEAVAKELGLSLATIYNWKRKLGQIKSQHNHNEQKKLMKRYYEIKDQTPKISDENIAKMLIIGTVTLYKWKKQFRELGQSTPNKYSDSEQKELMKHYFEIKDQKPKIRDEDIAKMLKIGRVTLYRWKRQFKRQKLHPNSVDSVEENAAANVQEIWNSNSGSF